jgi:hypothetical protein
MRTASLISIIVTAASIGPAFADTLTCSTFAGVRTCSTPDGYVSHELQWQGRTNGWDNQGDTWSTSQWQDREITTSTPRLKHRRGRARTVLEPQGRLLGLPGRVMAADHAKGGSGRDTALARA